MYLSTIVQIRGALDQFAERLLEKFEEHHDDMSYSAREIRMDWELFGALAQADSRISDYTTRRLAAYDS